MGEKEEAKLKSRQSIKTGGGNARVYMCMCVCSCLYTGGTLHLMGRGHISLHWLLMHFPSMQGSDCQAWFIINQHQLELFMFACVSHPSKWRWPARRCRTHRIYPWRCHWRDSQHPGQHGKQKKTDYNVFTAPFGSDKDGSWVGYWLKIQALSSSLLVSCCLLERTGTHTSTPTHTRTKVHFVNSLYWNCLSVMSQSTHSPIFKSIHLSGWLEILPPVHSDWNTVLLKHWPISSGLTHSRHSAH